MLNYVYEQSFELLEKYTSVISPYSHKPPIGKGKLCLPLFRVAHPFFNGQKFGHSQSRPLTNEWGRNAHFCCPQFPPQPKCHFIRWVAIPVYSCTQFGLLRSEDFVNFANRTDSNHVWCAHHQQQQQFMFVWWIVLKFWKLFAQSVERIWICSIDDSGLWSVSNVLEIFIEIVTHFCWIPTALHMILWQTIKLELKKGLWKPLLFLFTTMSQCIALRAFCSFPTTAEGKLNTHISFHYPVIQARPQVTG